MNQKRTVEQNRRIYGLRLALCKAGMELEDVVGVIRQIAVEVSGQEHTSLLTVGQANALIGQLEERLRQASTRSAAVGSARPRAVSAPHEPWGERGGNRAEEPITGRQLEIIDRLATEAGLVTLPQRAGFYARQLGGRRRLVTQADADAVIEPLKAMLRRRVDPDTVCRRLEAVAEHPTLATDAWLAGFVADVLPRVRREGRSAISPGRLAKLREAEELCGIVKEGRP